MPPKEKVRPEPKVEVPQGDSRLGRMVFDQQCSACHELQGEVKGATAPPIGGINGRKAGSTAFKYSNAMKKSGIVWSEKHLFEYLKAPAKYVPGTQMAFAGIPDEKERADLIAYIL